MKIFFTGSLHSPALEKCPQPMNGFGGLNADRGEG